MEKEKNYATKLSKVVNERIKTAVVTSFGVFIGSCNEILRYSVKIIT